VKAPYPRPPLLLSGAYGDVDTSNEPVTVERFLLKVWSRQTRSWSKIRIFVGVYVMIKWFLNQVGT